MTKYWTVLVCGLIDEWLRSLDRPPQLAVWWEGDDWWFLCCCLHPSNVMGDGICSRSRGKDTAIFLCSTLTFKERNLTIMISVLHNVGWLKIMVPRHSTSLYFVMKCMINSWDQTNLSLKFKHIDTEQFDVANYLYQCELSFRAFSRKPRMGDVGETDSASYSKILHTTHLVSSCTTTLRGLSPSCSRAGGRGRSSEWIFIDSLQRESAWLGASFQN